MGTETVDTIWERFLNILDATFRDACTLVSETHDDDSVRRAALNRLRQTGVKGHCPTWKERAMKRCNGRANASDMALVKQRKKVARLFELIRIIKLRNWMGCNTYKGQDLAKTCHDLTRKLRISGNLPLRDLLQQVQLAQSQLRDMEAQYRLDRLTAWKQKFTSDLKFAGRWLKNSTSQQGIKICDNHGTACSAREGIAKIHAFWEHFWRDLKD